MNTNTLLIPFILLITILAVSYDQLRFDDDESAYRTTLGLQKLTMLDTTRIFEGSPRALEVTLWYPTHQTTPQQSIASSIWHVHDVIMNASLSTEQPLPLIIFSHGYGGNEWSNSWFAEHLAPYGYIVAVVKHYGNNRDAMIPELSVRPWHRPADLNFVLDTLLQDPFWSKHIDRSRIGAAGFSQGGIACLWLAGIRAQLTPDNLKQQITALSDPEWRNEHFAHLPAQRLDTILDQFTADDFDAANRSYYNPLIKAVFTLAPALDAANVMFTAHGVSSVTIPIHVTVGEADPECVEQAQFFTQYIPYSTLTVLPGNVTHLTMLNEGTAKSIADKSVYVIDHPSINRKAVHDTIAHEAIQFFNHYLKT